jgi:hypothetical protein
MAGPQDDWSVPRRARSCALSEREFAAGDRVVTELFDRGDAFERRDRLESVEPPEGDATPFSRWSFVVPAEPERRPGVDLDLAMRFLRDLIAANDPERRPLAQVLSLLLVRKRRLKIVERGTSSSGDRVVRATIPGPEDDEMLEIPDPPLTPEVVASVTREVNDLFGFEERVPETPIEAGVLDDTATDTETDAEGDAST